MSKSKSRQPSRQVSAASRSGSGGTARTAALSKPTAKIAVEDAPASTEQDEATVTSAETVSSKVTTKIVADDTVEGAEQETPVDKTTRTLTSKATTKIAADVPASKSAKAVPATPASGKSAPAKAVPNTPPLKTVPATPAGINGRPLSRDAAKYERRQAERQSRFLAERRRRRNRIITAISIILVLAVIGGGVYYIVHQYTTATTSTASQHAAQGSYQEPIFNSTYPPVDSVYCDQLEQSIEHIHAYIAIYIDGKASPLPAYVGIPQDQSGNATCYYWLHTHDASGIVHIESPSNEIFTFGQFRDEWDQQFASVGFPPELLLNGWKIWVNGKVYNGSLTSVPLEAHNIITLAYNSPNVKPVTTYNWGSL